MANVHFVDNSIKVTEAIEAAAIKFLHEAAGELETQVKRNTRVDTSKTKQSWQYKIDKGNLVAYVGSPLENAIWEEFGTGEYAANGKGAKPYWVYVKGGGKKSSSPKTYTLEQAKRVVAMLRSKGLDAYYSKGKRGTRALEKAKNSVKPKINKAAKEAFKNV